MPLMDHPEEDRFIRGLAVSPEDEALRLVYADWLEEHGHHARSIYMRKEVEHFRDPDSGPEDAGWPWVTHCDTVWLAMVSRPPFGILRPGLTFSGGMPPITSADLTALEEHWKTTLPPDYAAFLLLHNGGLPSMRTLFLDLTGYDECLSGSLRLFGLGEMSAFSGKTAHWTSASAMCSRFHSEGQRRAFGAMMLVGAVDGFDEPAPCPLFRMMRAERQLYQLFQYADDRMTLESADWFLGFDSLIDLLGQLHP